MAGGEAQGWGDGTGQDGAAGPWRPQRWGKVQGKVQGSGRAARGPSPPIRL